jgi:serine/threonine protein kinase
MSQKHVLISSLDSFLLVQSASTI